MQRVGSWLVCLVCLACVGAGEVQASTPKIALNEALFARMAGTLSHQDQVYPRAQWVSEIKSEPLLEGNNNMPMEWPLLLLQGFSGAIVATVGSIVLQSVMDILIQSTAPNLTPEQRQTSGFISAAVVFVAMPWLVALTVWSLGKLSNNYTTSYWWVLVGALAGQLVASGVGLLLNAVDTSVEKGTTRAIRFVLDGVLAGLGAVVMYGLFRKPHQGIQQIGTLLRYHDGRWAMGIPVPMVAPTDRGVQLHIPLLAGRF